MKNELLVEIIWYIGYVSLSCFLLLIAIGFLFFAYKLAMEWDFFFKTVFNDRFDKRLKEISEDDLNRWLENLKERFNKKGNK